MKLKFWAKEAYRYQIGDVVRVYVSTGTAIPERRIVSKRSRFKGTPFYCLKGKKYDEGWYGENILQPYDPIPIPHPGPQLASR